MSKSNLPAEVNAEASEALESEPKLNRIERFLKEKAARQHRTSGHDAHGHKQQGHAKLKERVRRRP